MKLGKPEMAVIAVTAALMLFAAGYYMGRATAAPDGSVTVLTERTPPAAAVSAAPAPQSETPPQNAPAEAEAGGDPLPLDLNTADADSLATLPGIGEKLAQRIVDYRETVGPFTSVEELTEVEGIGAGKLEAILELVYIGGNEP